MRTMSHKGLALAFFLLLALTGLGQKKDSVKTAPGAKEDGLQVKKRKFQYFVSNRLCEDDKFDLFKFIPSDKEPSVIIIKGHFECVDKPEKKRAKISVYNVTNNEVVGVYNTNNYTGYYLMVLVPNIKYLFKVECEGYEVSQEVVEVPLKFDYETGKQEIKIRRNDQKKTVLNVTNYFSDESEKVFFLRASIDSTRKDAEEAGYSDKENKNNGKGEKNYSTVDELVKKQLEEEKKKPSEAQKAFRNKEYATALPLYAIMVKNDPGDPFMNYYYGVCLLKSTRNKAKAIACLEMAAHFKDVPRDVFLYLAEAYHLSYMFKDAMRSMEEYKKYAKPGDPNQATLLQLFNYCKSGAELMSDQVNIEVIRRAQVQETNLLSNYNPDFINDKLMYKTDFFCSAIDKKKEKLLMCKVGKEDVYHASYGVKEGETDLYRNAALPNGSFGAAQSLGPDINTTMDENYPYVSKDRKTLYFSSKGHNSMGGYDIFKCTRADSLSPWGKPENMGFPINSTYDDILYIPDPENRYASFCSNRKNEKFEYIQIKTPQKALAYSIIKGNFSIDSSEKKDAIITVFNSSTEEIAGVYKTNSESGNYLMVLTAGQSYYMTVESENYPEFKSAFVLPEKKGDFILKQTIQFPDINALNGFSVKNYFTEEQANAVTFENTTAKKTKEVVKTKKETDHKGEIRVGKPKRTAEETAQDQQNLKDARSLFEQENYQEAAVIYRQLEINIDLDAQALYNYGVCLYYSKKDKQHCADVLEDASQGKGVPPEVFYYLGKADHLNYKFSAAIKAYQKYMAVAKPADIERLSINKEIEYCNNGLKLVNNPVVIEVFDKKHISLESIHTAFTHLESGAKILISTEDILSSIDKKKKYKPVIFLSPDKNTIYYSSYGETEDNGKDIYCIKKLGNGKWSPVPFNIPGINTPYDEEFPCVTPDGKTLFFSSKGFNTMGGYDIYKCNWNENTQSWGEPINLGSPINSPYDDIYYVE